MHSLESIRVINDHHVLTKHEALTWDPACNAPCVVPGRPVLERTFANREQCETFLKLHNVALLD
jgi:hypothetical protein